MKIMEVGGEVFGGDLGEFLVGVFEMVVMDKDLVGVVGYEVYVELIEKWCERGCN